MIDAADLAIMVPPLRASARKIASHTPPLTARDVGGLFILQAEMLVQPLLLRSTKLTARSLAPVETMAVYVALEVEAELVFRAGFLPREPCEQEQGFAHLKATYLPWRWELGVLGQEYELRPNDRPGDARKAKLIGWYQAIMRQGVASEQKLRATIRRQLAAVGQWGSDLDERAAFAALVLLREAADRLDGIGWIDADGKVTIGRTVLRDSLRPSRGRAVEAVALAVEPEDEQSVDPLVVADILEQVQRLRDVIAGREVKVAAGSARALVLAHFLDLFDEVLSFAELSRRSGLSESGLREAFATEYALVQNRMRCKD